MWATHSTRANPCASRDRPYRYLVLDVVLYWLAILYVDEVRPQRRRRGGGRMRARHPQVLPGMYGVPRPPCFCITDAAAAARRGRAPAAAAGALRSDVTETVNPAEFGDSDVASASARCPHPLPERCGPRCCVSLSWCGVALFG